MQLRRDAKWWGWGNPAVAPTLDERALGVLRERIGEREAWPLARSLGEFELPAAEALPAALVATVGEENVFVDDEDRLRHAAGRGYVDLARLRNGALEAAPDAVLMPRAAAALQRVLEICSAEGVAVVPFGGGTSVVGGVEPDRGPFAAVVSLDLRRLDGFAADSRSLLATMGAGLSGPLAEKLLNDEGLTLGHFPQSFEHATIGGYVATRSAGQASTGYGRIDELVRGLRMATPSGELVLKPVPASAAGPSLLGLAVGSEGAFGVITDATLGVRPLPEA